jgi:hypothetical protein
VLADLLYAAEKSERPEARPRVLLFDDTTAAHSAEIRAEPERWGTPIGGYDLLIAGPARSPGLVLTTGNLREFNRVGGLRAEVGSNLIGARRELSVKVVRIADMKRRIGVKNGNMNGIPRSSREIRAARFPIARTRC